MCHRAALTTILSIHISTTSFAISGDILSTEKHRVSRVIREFGGNELIRKKVRALCSSFRPIDHRSSIDYRSPPFLVTSQLVTNILTLGNVIFAISHTRDLIIGGIWSVFAAALPHLFNQISADGAPFGKERSADIYLSLSA